MVKGHYETIELSGTSFHKSILCLIFTLVLARKMINSGNCQ